ncbi:MAG TPA: hypothetical protein DDW50_16795 [Firmicutes bacterium]|jgi:Tfp pilus assembly protein PilO|nr:hypothetical protein [Bacillota bacterium]
MPKIKIRSLLPAVAAGILFSSAVAGIYYFYNQTTEIAVEKQQKEAEIHAAEAKLKELPELTKEIKQLVTASQKMGIFIPSRENQDEFVRELDGLANQSGIKINSCQVNNKPKYYQDNPAFQVFQWRVELSGSYPGLLLFLKALPEAKRAIKAADLSLKANQPASDDDPKLRYILNIQMTLDLIAMKNQVTEKDTP